MNIYIPFFLFQQNNNQVVYNCSIKVNYRYIENSNQQAIFIFVTQMQINHAEIQSQYEILHFFSSYLKDILQLTADIKFHTYELIGIQAPQRKRTAVNSNIYSIMEACSHSFQDLRRAQTLLRGHLKGKSERQRDQDSARQSRFTIQNGFYNSNNIVPKNFKKSFQKLQFISENQPPRISIQENYFTSIANEEVWNSNSVNINMEQEQSKVKTLKESKSHGQLINKRRLSPPSEASRIRSIISNTKEDSVALINKIREQLGLQNA